jgi:exopolysaccharide biosynthesis polyprenyl glycosylphosphotransferase
MASRSEMARQMPQEQVFVPEKPVVPAVFAGLWTNRGQMLFGLDLAICFVCFIGVYYVRFYLDLPGDEIFGLSVPVPPFAPYLKASILWAGMWVFLLWKDQSYRSDLHFSTQLAGQIRTVLITGLYATGFLMVVSFMFRQLLLSRLVYVTVFVVAGALLIVVRVCFRALARRLDEQCFTAYRILMVGWNKNAAALVDRLRERNRCTHVIGRLEWENRPRAYPDDIPILGVSSDLERIYDRTPFDKLLVVGGGLPSEDDTASRESLIRALNFCEEKNISYYMVPDFLDVAVTRTEVGSFAGVPLVLLQDSALHPAYAIAKRVMDLGISVVTLVLGLPLWLAIALLIKLTSKGPVFYAQERMGMYGKSFRMYKFRSMVPDADEQLRNIIDLDSLAEPVYKIPRDPRVTSIGKLLRRSGLDEIPQLINVLRGEMSVVGPRPEWVGLAQRYEPWERRRLKAKPGITGYQQVMSRGDPSLSKRIELDLYYLKHQGFFLDVFIMLKTMLVVCRGDGID